MSLTITDLFCGAGGSGLGAEAAGFELVMAANHWAKAIETHSANFPDTEHDCADISQVDPRRYRTTDVLWASPECTNHSQAKGVKRSPLGMADMFGDVLPDAAAERSRATMWDVPRFAERHAYRAIVVENVVEAAKWVGWRGWLTTMTDLGYDHQLVSLNSMHAQAIDAPRAPQSRDRLYIVFHRRGQRRPDVTLRPLAHCDQCSAEVAAIQAWKNGRTVGRYRAQYIYICPAGHTVEPYALPAAAAIDWSMPGQRIGDRIKPLSPKTMARIEAGLHKYAGLGRFSVTTGGEVEDHPLGVGVPRGAFTFEARGNTFVRFNQDGTPRYVRGWPVDQPTATLTTTETRALVVPVEGRDGKQARPTSEPIRTQSTRAETALVVPYQSKSNAYPSSSKGDGGEMCTPASEPIRTLTTTGHQSLVSIERQVEDATFRMLEPHEIQRAMAFHDGYRVLGNRRERVRQLGNGVTPPAAEFLLRAVAASLDVA